MNTYSRHIQSLLFLSKRMWVGVFSWVYFFNYSNFWMKNFCFLVSGKEYPEQFTHVFMLYKVMVYCNFLGTDAPGLGSEPAPEVNPPWEWTCPGSEPTMEVNLPREWTCPSSEPAPKVNPKTAWLPGAVWIPGAILTHRSHFYSQCTPRLLPDYWPSFGSKDTNLQIITYNENAWALTRPPATPQGC